LDSISNVSNDDQMYWLIKLHQREGTRSIWEKAVEKRGLKKVRVIRREMDFYALLAACDVHISFASTTLIEAAILGKPNLGLDVPHTSDPAGYAAARAFLPVAPGQLGPMACTILHAPLQKDALLREQKRFAEDWCVCDGKAVERIVRLIEATILDSNGERR
jgi:CDP-glycerol glycerophosphotransferase (TagB/SpsB family)